MTLLRNNFSGLTNGTTLTTGNTGGVSGHAFDAISIPSGGTLAADNTHPSNGKVALKVATTTTAGAVSAQWLNASLGSSQTLLYFSVSFLKTAAATPACRPITFRTSGGTHVASVLFSANSLSFSCGSGFVGAGNFTTVIPSNQYVRVEGHIDTSAGTIYAELYLSQYGTTPDETHTFTGLTTGGPIDRVDVGNGNSATSDGPFWIGDVGVSTTGPLGPAVVSGTTAIALKKMSVVAAFTTPVHARVTWDNSTDKTYSTGISQAVLYPKSSPGVAWNGLISVTEKGDDNTTGIVLDGQLAVAENLPGTFAGNLSAYMYPEELEPSLGNDGGYTSQPRETFGLCYKDNHQLHILYNVLLQPGSDKYQTLSDNSDALAFSWDFTTTPVDIPWGRPSAHLVIMVDYAQPGALSALEDVLYGNAANAPSLPDPLSIYNIFDPFAVLKITDNGDGTWTANDQGNGAISMVDGNHFQITWPSAVFLSDTTYRIHSL